MKRKAKTQQTKLSKTTLNITPKRRVNFFKYPSLQPNPVNQKEMMALMQNVELDKVASRIRNQARSISVSIPLLNGFFDMLASEIYGEKGFILDITTADKKLNIAVQNAFYEWEKKADIYGNFDFEDFESLVLNALFRDGEAFIKLHKTPNGLNLEFIDADEIDNDLTDESKNLYYGIEFEPNSQTPKTYHQKLQNGKYALIDAKNIIHIKKSHLARQKRGVSLLASSIFDTHSKDKFKKAELDRARLASEITGFFTRKNEAGNLSVSFDDNGEPVDEINIPDTATIGKMGYLGDDIQPHFIDPHNPTNIEFFFKIN